ncbi:hypothetical protein BHM03_00013715 [Ensete ventricosum]|uniref:Uncharacterized protein n=1 Tax=Ensete ventricosum TaxID=4639 RepID=A0A445ME35_ENSVE|nr:hypothetical protein BHM03_00013715 [Ensete ventricosum]
MKSCNRTSTGRALIDRSGLRCRRGSDSIWVLSMIHVCDRAVNGLTRVRVSLCGLQIGSDLRLSPDPLNTVFKSLICVASNSRLVFHWPGAHLEFRRIDDVGGCGLDPSLQVRFLRPWSILVPLLRPS